MKKFTLISVLFSIFYTPLFVFGIDPEVEKSLEMKKLDYELRERCGKRAVEFFKDHKAENEGKFEIFFYRNHYNKRLNKCFILEWFAKSAKDPTTKVVYDVNEHSIYGYCGEGGKEREHDCNSSMWKALLKETMEE